MCLFVCPFVSVLCIIDLHETLKTPAIRVLSIGELFQNTTTVTLPLWPCDIPTRNDTSVVDTEQCLGQVLQETVK